MKQPRMNRKRSWSGSLPASDALLSRELQRLNWLTVQRLVPETITTLILPVGTVEAHGSACLGTDNVIPETISLGIAERINALVAPILNYGITRSLYRYAGGSTISPDTYTQFVLDILRSASVSKFQHVFIMNGHGGNNSALKQAALEAHHEFGLHVAVIHWWELCQQKTEHFFGHAGGHAGTDETAIVIAVDPLLADEKAYAPELAYTFRAGADIYPVPGTILLYKDGEGYPEFDLARAKQYRELVIEEVGTFCELIQKRWRSAGF